MPEEDYLACWIGGTGRSGTTAIGRLLGHHPALFRITDELRFHSAPEGLPALLSGEEDLPAFRHWMLTKMFRRPSPNATPKGLHRRVSEERLTSLLDDFERRYAHDPAAAVRSLFIGIIARHLERRGAQGFVEATPDNGAAGDTLLSCFPTSRLVITVRDGRDVISSVMRQQWGPDAWQDALQWWAERTRAIARSYDRIQRAGWADRVLVLHLEDLVGPERDRARTDLLAHLGLVDHPDVTAHHDEHFTSSRANIGCWMRDLGFWHRRRLDAAYRRTFEQLSLEGVYPLPVAPA